MNAPVQPFGRQSPDLECVHYVEAPIHVDGARPLWHY